MGLLTVGCQPPEPAGPDQLVVRPNSRFEQPKLVCGAPGSRVGPLTVQVLGQVIQGVPGRNGRRDPVPDTEVTFRFKFKLREENEYLESFPFVDQFGELGKKPKSIGSPRPDAAPPATPQLVPPSFIPHPDFPEGDRTVLQPDPERPLVQEAVVTTDRDGYARIYVELGSFVGEYRVEAETRSEFEKRRPVDFWLISGVKILEDDPLMREGPVGTALDVALELSRVDDSELDADKDRAVLFSVRGPGGENHGAELSKEKDRTNKEGIATVKLKLGRHAGTYEVLAEIEPTESYPAVRTLVLDYYAVDWLQFGLRLLGGVALFALGLRILANGLLVRLNPYLHLSTGAFARNRALGFLGGVIVGGSLQSSSTAVSRLMVFANGGLLLAVGASGQILGANLGRTVLLQALAFELVALLGVPLLAAGALFFVFEGRLRSRSWGSVLLGAGLIISGFVFFCETADLAALSPSARALLESWDPANPRAIPGVIFGADVLLALIAGALFRNSSLILVAAVAFAMRGLISPTMVVALMLGANLGSSLWILLTSFRRNREARRVALLNTFFVVVGGTGLAILTAVPLGGEPLILRLADWTTPGHFFHPQPENVEHHLAMVYTLFHLGNGLLCLALTPWAHRLVSKVIPRDPVNDNVKPYHLDPSLLDVPALALAQATREVVYLLEVVRKTIGESFDAFRYRDLNLADQTSRREETVNTIQREVSRYLLEISENSLPVRLASRLQCLQAAVANLARIGKQGELLRDLAVVALEEKVQIPEDVSRELTELYDIVMDQFENVLRLLENPDRRTEENAVKLGERLARSVTRIESSWIQRASQEASAEYIDAARRLLPPGEPGPRPPIPVEGRDVATAEGGARREPGASVTGVTMILCREAYSNLVLVARHLAHIAERMRVLAAE